MPQEPQYGTVKVLTPNPSDLNQDVLRKPFVLYAPVNHLGYALGVISIPNILDVLGMPSGGGPPGFTVLEHDSNKAGLPRFCLIVGFIPGSRVVIANSDFFLGSHIGTTTSAGIVVNYFNLCPSSGGNLDAALESEETLRVFLHAQGYAPVRLIEYTTPPALLGTNVAVPSVIPTGPTVPGPAGETPTGNE
jgi:hypothetical protein